MWDFALYILNVSIFRMLACFRKKQINSWRCYHNRKWYSETRRRENIYCVCTFTSKFINVLFKLLNNFLKLKSKLKIKFIIIYNFAIGILI